MDNLVLSPIPLKELLGLFKTIVDEALEASAAGQVPVDGNTSPNKPFTQTELCEYLRVSPQTLIRWRKKKKIPFFLVGESPRFILSDVLKALSK